MTQPQPALMGPHPVASARPRPVVMAVSIAQMQALERDWKQLTAWSQPQNPFLSWEWQRAWLQSGAGRARPVIAAEAFTSGSLAGLLALQRRRHYGLVQLETLGQGSGADEVDALLHPQAPSGITAHLLRAAVRRCRPDLLRLEGLRQAGALVEACGAAELGEVEIEPGELMPYLRLPSSFDEYLAQQSANFRAEVRRRRRRLFESLPEVGLDPATTAPAVGQAMGELFRLHNLRRAQKHGRGLFRTPALCRFHRQAARALAARGAARVYVLRQRQQPIAALYGLEAGGRFLYFQSGFDPAFTRLSPGTVLLSLVIEDCIRRGLKEFDFLRGEEMYKSRWTAEQRSGRSVLAALTGRGRAYLALRRRWRQWHQAQVQRAET